MEGEQLLLPSFFSPLVLGWTGKSHVYSVFVCVAEEFYPSTIFVFRFNQFITRSIYALTYLFALAVFLDLKLGIVLLGTYLASKGLVVPCLGGGALCY